MGGSEPQPGPGTAVKAICGCIQFILSIAVMSLGIVVVHGMGCPECDFYTNELDKEWCHIMIFPEGVDYEGHWFAATETQSVLQGGRRSFSFEESGVKITATAEFKVDMPSSVDVGGRFMRAERCTLYEEPVKGEEHVGTVVFHNASSPEADLLVFPHCRQIPEDRYYPNGLENELWRDDSTLAQYRPAELPTSSMIVSIVVWWFLYNIGLIVSVAIDFLLEGRMKNVATLTTSAFFWVYTGLLLLPFASMSVHKDCPQIVMFNHFEVAQEFVLAGVISLPIIGAAIAACFFLCRGDDAAKEFWMFVVGSYGFTIFSWAVTLIMLQVYLGGFYLFIPGLDFRFLFGLFWNGFAVKISAIRIILFTIFLLSTVKDFVSIVLGGLAAAAYGT